MRSLIRVVTILAVAMLSAATILTTADAAPIQAPTESVSILITEDKVESGRDGYLARTDGTKQWLDPDCRNRLEAIGVPVEVVEWSSIAALPNGNRESCSDLLTTLGTNPGDEHSQPLDARLLHTAGQSDGWFVVDEGRQWISPDCRSELIGAGIVAEAVSWDKIASFDQVERQSCDDLVSSYGDQPSDRDGPTNPGGGPDEDPSNHDCVDAAVITVYDAPGGAPRAMAREFCVGSDGNVIWTLGAADWNQLPLPHRYVDGSGTPLPVDTSELVAAAGARSHGTAVERLVWRWGVLFVSTGSDDFTQTSTTISDLPGAGQLEAMAVGDNSRVTVWRGREAWTSASFSGPAANWDWDSIQWARASGLDRVDGQVVNAASTGGETEGVWVGNSRTRRERVGSQPWGESLTDLEQVVGSIVPGIANAESMVVLNEASQDLSTIANEVFEPWNGKSLPTYECLGEIAMINGVPKPNVGDRVVMVQPMGFRGATLPSYSIVPNGATAEDINRLVIGARIKTWSVTPENQAELTNMVLQNTAVPLEFAVGIFPPTDVYQSVCGKSLVTGEQLYDAERVLGIMFGSGDIIDGFAGPAAAIWRAMAADQLLQVAIRNGSDLPVVLDAMRAADSDDFIARVAQLDLDYRLVDGSSGTLTGGQVAEFLRPEGTSADTTTGRLDQLRGKTWDEIDNIVRNAVDFDGWIKPGINGRREINTDRLVPLVQQRDPGLRSALFEDVGAGTFDVDMTSGESLSTYRALTDSSPIDLKAVNDLRRPTILDKDGIESIAWNWRADDSWSPPHSAVEAQLRLRLDDGEVLTLNFTRPTERRVLVRGMKMPLGVNPETYILGPPPGGLSGNAPNGTQFNPIVHITTSIRSPLVSTAPWGPYSMRFARTTGYPDSVQHPVMYVIDGDAFEHMALPLSLQIRGDGVYNNSTTGEYVSAAIPEEAILGAIDAATGEWHPYQAWHQLDVTEQAAYLEDAIEPATAIPFDDYLARTDTSKKIHNNQRDLFSESDRLYWNMPEQPTFLMEGGEQEFRAAIEALEQRGWTRSNPLDGGPGEPFAVKLTKEQVFINGFWSPSDGGKLYHSDFRWVMSTENPTWTGVDPAEVCERPSVLPRTDGQLICEPTNPSPTDPPTDPGDPGNPGQPPTDPIDSPLPQVFSVDGVAVDASGGPLPSKRLTLTGASSAGETTSLETSTGTDDQVGRFSFSDVPPGVYNVTLYAGNTVTEAVVVTDSNVSGVRISEGPTQDLPDGIEVYIDRVVWTDAEGTQQRGDVECTYDPDDPDGPNNPDCDPVEVWLSQFSGCPASSSETLGQLFGTESLANPSYAEFKNNYPYYANPCQQITVEFAVGGDVAGLERRYAPKDSGCDLMNNSLPYAGSLAFDDRFVNTGRTWTHFATGERFPVYGWTTHVVSMDHGLLPGGTPDGDGCEWRMSLRGCDNSGCTGATSKRSYAEIKGRYDPEGLTTQPPTPTPAPVPVLRVASAGESYQAVADGGVVELGHNSQDVMFSADGSQETDSVAWLITLDGTEVANVDGFEPRLNLPGPGGYRVKATLSGRGGSTEASFTLRVTAPTRLNTPDLTASSPQWGSVWASWERPGNATSGTAVTYEVRGYDNSGGAWNQSHTTPLTSLFFRTPGTVNRMCVAVIATAEGYLDSSTASACTNVELTSQPPTADMQLVGSPTTTATLVDGEWRGTFALDGSGSDDPDSYLQSYELSWSDGQLTEDWSTDWPVDVSFPLGPNSVRFRVSDETSWSSYANFNDKLFVRGPKIDTPDVTFNTELSRVEWGTPENLVATPDLIGYTMSLTVNGAEAVEHNTSNEWWDVNLHNTICVSVLAEAEYFVSSNWTEETCWYPPISRPLPDQRPVARLSVSGDSGTVRAGGLATVTVDPDQIHTVHGQPSAFLPFFARDSSDPDGGAIERWELTHPRGAVGIYLSMPSDGARIWVPIGSSRVGLRVRDDEGNYSDQVWLDLNVIVGD